MLYSQLLSRKKNSPVKTMRPNVFLPRGLVWLLIEYCGTFSISVIIFFFLNSYIDVSYFHIIAKCHTEVGHFLKVFVLTISVLFPGLLYPIAISVPKVICLIRDISQTNDPKLAYLIGIFLE